MRDRRGRIFVSYRRADSAAVVDHLYDRLVARYGRKCIFRDIDNIPLGMDFRQHVTSVLGECDIVLAVIGTHWSGGKGAASRIMRADDPIRTEIEVAMESGALMVPVLVGGAKMPDTTTLPPSLAEFSAINAATLATGLDFENHLSLLFRKLDEALRHRGKTCLKRPEWIGPAVWVGAIAAVTPLLLFVASALFDIPFGSAVVPASVVAMALAAALATALFVADLILLGRISWSQPQQWPYLAAAVLFAVTLPAYYWAGNSLTAAIPIRDTSHLSKQLLVAFSEARAQLTATGHADFTRAHQLANAIREIDPDNGTAWYYDGEIARRENPQLFDAQSCFRGWRGGKAGSLDAFEEDFERYLATEAKLGEMAQSSDWGTRPCYDEGRGYCPQRTAWVYHLLATDNYQQAIASSGPDRRELLDNAREYATAALRFTRSTGGSGFTQCGGTANVLDEAKAALPNGSAAAG